MKTITIRQPYASLIINGYKKFEFRSWPTKYRGKLLIHAGKQIDKEMMKKVKHLNLEYPTGAIIGMVNIQDCVKMNSDILNDISKDPIIYGNKDVYDGYIWVISEPKQFRETIKTNGKLSFWEYNIKNDNL